MLSGATEPLASMAVLERTNVDAIYRATKLIVERGDQGLFEAGNLYVQTDILRQIGGDDAPTRSVA